MIKEFTIGASHTINLGHYESLRVEASVTMTVNEQRIRDGEDDLDEIKAEAQVELRQLLETTYLKQKRKNHEQRESSSTG